MRSAEVAAVRFRALLSINAASQVCVSSGERPMDWGIWQSMKIRWSCSQASKTCKNNQKQFLKKNTPADESCLIQ